MSKTVDHLDAAKDNISGHVQDSMEQVAKTSGKTRKRIRKGASEVEDHVREAGQEIREHSEESLHTVNDFVRGNPLVSLGLAFSAGILASALKKRRS